MTLCLITTLPTLSQTLSTESNLIAVPRTTLEKALKVKAERDLCVEELRLTQQKVVLYSKSIDLYKVEVDPDVFDRVELHDHIERKDGNGLKFMEMLEIPQMEIDAGGTLFLRCGGKHLMLIGIKKTLCQFEKLKFIFHFRVGAKEFTKAIEIDFKKSLLDPKNKRCEAE